KIFLECEDEIASMAAIIGASWGGAKAMTATSGPGFSLMQENLSMAYFTETPCVIALIQRSGPSTGQATYPGQQEFYQSNYGIHGDAPAIVYAPWSVQEMYDLTIKAFNAAEKYRMPVIVLADGEIGHMRENVVLGRKGIELVERKRPDYTKIDRIKIEPFAITDDLIPPMPHFGEGAEIKVTGSTHEPDGMRNATTAIHQELLERIIAKVDRNKEKIIENHIDIQEGAKVGVIAFGVSARMSYAAVQKARKEGKKVSFLRPKVVWPFPDEEIKEIFERYEKIIVPEMNAGQMVREVERVVGKKVKVKGITKLGGVKHALEEIYCEI
ncbi:MAG: 2-oxoacid:acceptor oxidoreductase subunit alpha, partial [Candidatus Heimdallarchaeota archaeon]|nr:2-oxoacid:acceptor oxidoreductase subunit alpha [Candidatus Heimdallarchaeota archaeon]